MNPLAILTAIWGLPGAISNTLALIRLLTGHNVIKNLITTNAALAEKISAVEAIFTKLEADIAAIRSAGFLSQTFFADIEQMAADGISGMFQLIGIYTDPNILKEVVADPSLQSLLTTLYTTAKQDLSLLGAFGVKIPIPPVVASVATTLETAVQEAAPSTTPAEASSSASTSGATPTDAVGALIDPSLVGEQGGNP